METDRASYTFTSNPLVVNMITDGLDREVTAYFTAPEPQNNPPIAGAGQDQTVAAGDGVSLDGSGSSDPDPDDGIQSYRWQQTAGLGVTLSDASAEKPTFTAPAISEDQATLIFELMVEDYAGAIDTDTVIIIVMGFGNRPPLADAGEDQEVNAGEQVTLDGSGSSDPDNGIQNYSWQQTTGPGVTLSEASAGKPTFTAPDVYAAGNPAILVFKLTVTDNADATAEDYVTITVYLKDSVSGGGCFISEALR